MYDFSQLCHPASILTSYPKFDFEGSSDFIIVQNFTRSIFKKIQQQIYEKSSNTNVFFNAFPDANIQVRQVGPYSRNFCTIVINKVQCCIQTETDYYTIDIDQQSQILNELAKTIGHFMLNNDESKLYLTFHFVNITNKFYCEFFESIINRLKNHDYIKISVKEYDEMSDNELKTNYYNSIIKNYPALSIVLDIDRQIVFYNDSNQQHHKHFKFDSFNIYDYIKHDDKICIFIGICTGLLEYENTKSTLYHEFINEHYKLDEMTNERCPCISDNKLVDYSSKNCSNNENTVTEKKEKEAREFKITKVESDNDYSDSDSELDGDYLFQQIIYKSEDIASVMYNVAQATYGDNLSALRSDSYPDSNNQNKIEIKMKNLK